MLLAFLLSMLQCTSREMRVTFYRLAEGTKSMLTKMGHEPVAFQTAAVSDRRLLGRWLYVEEFGGWVYASDTGRPCRVGKPGPCRREDTIDIFVGAGHLQPHARRLGVRYWTLGVCTAPIDALRPAPTRAVDRTVAAPPSALRASLPDSP
jgi:hypothetical protein